VQIVRWSCCGAGLGIVFRVDAISTSPDSSELCCAVCRGQHPAGRYALGAGSVVERRGAPLVWLRRIPPLSELEGEKRDEEIVA